MAMTELYRFPILNQTMGISIVKHSEDATTVGITTTVNVSQLKGRPCISKHDKIRTAKEHERESARNQAKKALMAVVHWADEILAEAEAAKRAASNELIKINQEELELLNNH